MVQISKLPFIYMHLIYVLTLYMIVQYYRFILEDIFLYLYFTSFLSSCDVIYLLFFYLVSVLSRAQSSKILQISSSDSKYTLR